MPEHIVISKDGRIMSMIMKNDTSREKERKIWRK
jgi:hypothetical protein